MEAVYMLAAPRGEYSPFIARLQFGIQGCMRSRRA
jgi:hypothetical protein